MLRRLITIAVLVAGCASPTLSNVELTEPPATAGTVASPATLSREFCEAVLESAPVFEDTLTTFAGAFGDPDAEATVVDATVDYAESLLDLDELANEPRHPMAERMHRALTAVDESRLDYLQGDATPFIDSLLPAAVAARAISGVC
jgi:hypothetical protein